jgi:hypothetical protein
VAKNNCAASFHDTTTHGNRLKQYVALQFGHWLRPGHLTPQQKRRVAGALKSTLSECRLS